MSARRPWSGPPRPSALPEVGDSARPPPHFALAAAGPERPPLSRRAPPARRGLRARAPPGAPPRRPAAVGPWTDAASGRWLHRGRPQGAGRQVQPSRSPGARRHRERTELGAARTRGGAGRGAATGSPSGQWHPHAPANKETRRPMDSGGGTGSSGLKNICPSQANEQASQQERACVWDPKAAGFCHVVLTGTPECLQGSSRIYKHIPVHIEGL
ncbi:basic salivary proline-rich protein 1-like [Apodemus sylvaticus]|uniref:basic salivary proline-rich protein 1-like n=1 Tax=Apodemus sylvaticus TaxID=10129 RepID=UPI0022426793|nr:basic salivary proline-rich protein 1-like [Apodemus sylvaticus]